MGQTTARGGEEERGGNKPTTRREIGKVVDGTTTARGGEEEKEGAQQWLGK